MMRMLSLFKYSFSFIVISLLICSCTITKRKHRKGYHIEVLSNEKSDESADSISTDTIPSERKESFEIRFPLWEKGYNSGFAVGTGIHTLYSLHVNYEFKAIGAYVEYVNGPLNYASVGIWVDGLWFSKRNSLCFGFSWEGNAKIHYEYFLPLKDRREAYYFGFDLLYIYDSKNNEEIWSHYSDVPMIIVPVQVSFGYKFPTKN